MPPRSARVASSATSVLNCPTPFFYAAGAAEGELTVVDTGTELVSDIAPVGQSLWGLTVSGASETLYNKPLLVGFRPFAGGGFVMYTTFHYHAQPSQQMIDTLEFLIFQL